MRKLFFLCLTIILAACEAEDNVPVLMWNVNQYADALPSISALQTFSYKQFKSEHLSQFGTNKELPRNILLFLQDSVSVEDISSHSNELKFLASQFNSVNSRSLFVPKVENPGFLWKDLHARGYNVINLQPGDSIAGISLKKDEKNLVVVHLPTTATNPSRSKALLKADEVIENVITKIGDLCDFTMIFTGLEASVKTDVNEHQRHKRFITDVDANSTLTHLYPTNCSLLYIRNSMQLVVGGANNRTYNLTDFQATALGDCQNSTGKLILKYIDVAPELTKLWVTIYFEIHNGRHWSATKAEISTRDASDGNYLHPRKEMMWVPLGYSYSCSQTLNLKSNSSDSGQSEFRLIIDGLQMEAFMTQNTTSFSDAWDCIGFFTIPIWMGLIVGFLLILILGWGMNMISELKTMDRFDDPKGKFILVPATAE